MAIGEPIKKEVAIRNLVEGMRKMREEEIAEYRKKGYSDEELKLRGLLEEEEFRLAELVEMSRGKKVAIDIRLTSERINKMFDATVRDLRDLNMPIEQTGFEWFLSSLTAHP